MIDCPEVIKELWQQDSVFKNFRVKFLKEPYFVTKDATKQSGKKYYTKSGNNYVEFTGSTFATGVTYYEKKEDLTNKNIVNESVSLTESLCSRGNIHFGLAEASTISFETVGVSNIAGERIACYMELDLSSLPATTISDMMNSKKSTYCPEVKIVDDIFEDERSVPVYQMIYGIFTVDDCKRDQANLKHRSITGYSTQLSTELKQVGYLPKKSLKFTQTEIFTAVTSIKEDMTLLNPTSTALHPVTPSSRNNFNVTNKECTPVTFTGIEQSKFVIQGLTSKSKAVILRGEFETDDYDYTDGEKAYKKIVANNSCYTTTFVYKKTQQTKKTKKNPSGVVSDLYYKICGSARVAYGITIGQIKPFYRVVAHYDFNNGKGTNGGITYHHDCYSYAYTFEPYSNVIVDFDNLKFIIEPSTKSGVTETLTAWDIEIFVPTKWNASASWTYTETAKNKTTKQYEPTVRTKAVSGWPIKQVHYRTGSVSMYYKAITRSDLDPTVTIVSDDDEHKFPNAGSTYYSFDDSETLMDLMNGYYDLHGVFGDFTRQGTYARKELPTTVSLSLDPDQYESFWFDDYTTEPVGKVLYPSFNFKEDTKGDDKYDIHSVKISSGRRSYDMSNNKYIRSMNFPTAEVLAATLDTDDLPVDTKNSTTVYPYTKKYLDQFKKQLMNLYIRTVIERDFATTGAKITYVPFELTMKALPYIEKGDLITIRSKDGVSISSYVLQRTLKGIQHIVDSITCDGESFVYTTGHSGKEVKTEADTENVFVKVYSSKGNIFKNNRINTVLSAVVTKGNITYTNSSDFNDDFGDRYYLQWQIMTDNGAYLTILNNDPRVGDNGFTFSVSPNDVYFSTKFRCNVVEMSDEEYEQAYSDFNLISNSRLKALADDNDNIFTVNVSVIDDETGEPTIVQKVLYAYTAEGYTEEGE